MVDRVYRTALPRLADRLRELRSEFRRAPTNVDWVGLRIDPLLRHLRSLESRTRSGRHAREIVRLPRGVGMFHADLVYFRYNVRELERVLAAGNRRAR